jgi:hypothetical protein
MCIRSPVFKSVSAYCVRASPRSAPCSILGAFSTSTYSAELGEMEDGLGRPVDVDVPRS